MKFVDYFAMRYPELKGDYGIPGELMQDTYKRWFEVQADFIDFKFKELEDKLNDHMGLS